MNKLIIYIMLASFSVSAQVNRSVHQIDNEYYSNNLQFVKFFNESKSPQLKKTTRNQFPGKTVFGFLPWWEYAAGSHQNIRYDLLTHIAISFFSSDEDGNLTAPQSWPWNEVINKARANKVKLIMAVSNFDKDQIHKILTDLPAQQKLFNNISDKIIINSFDGVNIDFENLQNGDEGSLLIDFMKSLNNFIKAKHPLAEVSFDSPIVGSGAWNFKELAEACDYLFIMGYGFYGSWSFTTGPSSPLVGNGYGLTYSINNFYSLAPPEKLILGVPYYGNYWITNSKLAYTTVTPYDSARGTNNWIKPELRYKEIIPQYGQKELMFDNVSQTSWLRWEQDGIWNQIWYDSDSSLALKYNLALTKNLKGVGIWALGYDDGRSELWNLIENKFVKTSVDENVTGVPDHFELYQNYPNPFNPETVISYRLSESGLVTLKVFDLLGRDVATLVNEYQHAGIYQISFHAKHASLSSGAYFCRLKIGSFSSTQKMILTK